MFSLIYNKYINYYDLITDCNFTDLVECNANKEINNDEITIDISEAINHTINMTETIEATEISEKLSDKLTITKESTFIENIEQEIINKSKEELKNNLDDIIRKIDIDKKYEIKGEDFILRISRTNESLFENSSYVNFEECENVLRNFYNISNTSILTLLQLEIENKDLNSLTLSSSGHLILCSSNII